MSTKHGKVDNSTLNHFHLVAGEIVFKSPKEENVSAVRVNTVLRTTSRNVQAHRLGKAQSGLQLVFRQNIGNVDVEIIDIVILNLSYMGEMTDAEFQQEAPEAAAPPKKKASLKVVPSDPYADEKKLSGNPEKDLGVSIDPLK